MKLIEKPSLPKEIFQQPVSPALLSQAVRVFLANQRQGTQSAKTRAQVNRTRKKLYKQKGTGGARHGDRKAPVFVGGGVAFAPKPRDHSLKLSTGMRQKAITGALTDQVLNKAVFVVSGMQDLSGKTAQLADFLNSLSQLNQKPQKLLIVTDTLRTNVYRAGRNINGLSITPVNMINTYEILAADKLLIMEEAVNLIGQKTPETEILINSSKKETKPKESPKVKPLIQRKTSSKPKSTKTRKKT